MSNELERVWAEADRRFPEKNPEVGCDSARRVAFKAGAEWAIAAMTPKTRALRRALGVLHVVEGDHYGRYCKSCSTNDRRVSDPCPTHRVLREFDMGNLPELPDSSPHDAWDKGFATGVDAGGRYMEQGGLDSDDVNPYSEPTQ